jgi:hypothetical protein
MAVTAITFWRIPSAAQKFLFVSWSRSKRTAAYSLLSTEALRRKLRHVGAWSPNEEVFQDFPIVCGGKGLFANLAMYQVIYDLCARTHAHHFIVRLTLRAFKFLIVVHWRADIQIADALQAPFNLSIRNRPVGKPAATRPLASGPRPCVRFC